MGEGRLIDDRRLLRHGLPRPVDLLGESLPLKGDRNAARKEVLRQQTDIGSAVENRLSAIVHLLQVGTMTGEPEGFVALKAAEVLGFAEHVRFFQINCLDDPKAHLSIALSWNAIIALSFSTVAGRFTIPFSAIIHEPPSATVISFPSPNRLGFFK